MNLVMLDIDGTLTESYDYDREIFGLAIGQVLNLPPVDAELTRFVHKTSLGVTEQAIRQATGREPGQEEIEAVKRNVLERLQDMHRKSPGIFTQVPGAGRFLDELRQAGGLVVSIATGCWRSEALIKLGASGLETESIPMATSDDDRDRQRIMQISARRAAEQYSFRSFNRVVYIGDGPWDLEFARRLGYGFIGIGHRLQAQMPLDGKSWHPDYRDPQAVLGSIRSALEDSNRRPA